MTTLESPHAAIESQVLRLFEFVTEGLASATAAFLASDRDAARDIVAADRSLDALQVETERMVEAELARAREGDDLQRLLAVLRIVPELERSGDLVEHIALRTPQNLATEITPEACRIVAEMGRVGVEMWKLAARAYAEHDPSAARGLRARDDELDDMHVQLCGELAASQIRVPVAIEMGLVARFLERLGDHAVNVARRVPVVAGDNDDPRQPGDGDG